LSIILPPIITGTLQTAIPVFICRLQEITIGTQGDPALKDHVDRRGASISSIRSMSSVD